MINFKENAAKKLFENGLISENEHQKVVAYRKLGIFSLHNELRAILYLSVVLITGGIGVLIYQNIDSIGHQVLLFLLLIAIGFCFYFSYKSAPKFAKTYTEFSNSMYDYLVLLGTILLCTFFGYLLYQYSVFGTQYGLVTLVPTVICFAIAYYFDNKSVLSIAITGLTAFIGVSINPQMILNFDLLNPKILGLSAITLGTILVAWSIYSEKNKLKTHFNFVFQTYAMHLIGLACLSNIIDGYWGVFLLILFGSMFYFYLESVKQKAFSLFIFSILYAYIGFNVLLFHLLENVDFGDLFELFVFIVPFYFIASIVGFIFLIKNFKKR
ncbi:DUF2157 domain-containing protein [uncultured Flavobacterium sp.]|uniref:DUF2157 domain-containing protein n=1 Tax=uncultured Flavobacterium sp. TaxID=165435 RepID=UPI0030EF0752|tara:strand:+ start:10988 stop:11965 length:978 start_codon:yes stop_codon:yes gene_type:complete